MRSEFPKNVQMFDSRKSRFRQINVHDCVFEEIKKISKKNYRSLNATVALMVKEYTKNTVVPADTGGKIE